MADHPARADLSPLALPSAAFRGLRLAGAFLTRLPFRPSPPAPGDHGWALVAFPLVGLIVGGLLTGVAVVGDGLGMGSRALLVLCTYGWLTGALHLDGLADVCDAAGSGRREAEALRKVMKDPRVGAIGATGLVLALGARGVFVSELLAAERLWPLWLAPVLSRFCASVVVLSLPYAGGSGLGHPFKRAVRTWQVVLGAACTLAAVAAVGLPGLGLSVAAGLGTAWIAAWGYRRLGGFTGDVCGACIEVSELAALALAAGLGTTGVR